MTLHSSSKPPSSRQHPLPSDVKKTPPKVKSIQIIEQAGVDELTPLQRQRLDTAVMLLVNYLASASSSS